MAPLNLQHISLLHLQTAGPSMVKGVAAIVQGTGCFWVAGELVCNMKPEIKAKLVTPTKPNLSFIKRV